MHSRHDTALLQQVHKSDGHRQAGIRVSAYQIKEQEASTRKKSMTCIGGSEGVSGCCL
jgi:hypothetical protein